MNISRLKGHKKFSLGVTAAVLLGLFGQQAVAHTRLTVASTPESSSAHGTTTTAVNIPHGCGDNAVIGNVIFLPDTADALVQTSTDNFENFESPEGATALDYMVNPAFVRLIKSNDVFEAQAFINDPLGNPLGFWAGGGSLPAHNWVGQLPFKITSVAIQPTSCAKEVVLVPGIANICNITGIDGIDGSNSDNLNVDFWTAPGVGTIYDAPSWNYPAKYTITRDTVNNPLPESCGGGMSVRIIPSAAQLNRDMPVKVDGVQVWPQP